MLLPHWSVQVSTHPLVGWLTIFPPAFTNNRTRSSLKSMVTMEPSGTTCTFPARVGSTFRISCVASSPVIPTRLGQLDEGGDESESPPPRIRSACPMTVFLACVCDHRKMWQRSKRWGERLGWSRAFGRDETHRRVNRFHRLANGQLCGWRHLGKYHNTVNRTKPDRLHESETTRVLRPDPFEILSRFSLGRSSRFETKAQAGDLSEIDNRKSVIGPTTHPLSISLTATSRDKVTTLIGSALTKSTRF